jgi:hypothetical protein
MHRDHTVFVCAVAEKRTVRVIFHSDDRDIYLSKNCVPMDYDPSTAEPKDSGRYYFWVPEDGFNQCTLILTPDRIVSMKKNGQSFDPADFVNWHGKWFLPRNWGKYS